MQKVLDTFHLEINFVGGQLLGFLHGHEEHLAIFPIGVSQEIIRCNLLS